MSNVASRSGPSRLVIAMLLSGAMFAASPSWGADDLSDLVDTSAAKAQPDSAPSLVLPPTGQQAGQGAGSAPAQSSLFGSIRQTPQTQQPQAAPATAPSAPAPVAAPATAPTQAPPPPSRPVRESANDFIDTAPPPPKSITLAPPPQKAAAPAATVEPPPKAPALAEQEAKPVAVKVDGAMFAEAQTSSRRVGRVMAGQTVTLLAQGDGWALIRTAGGVTGYVSADTVAQAKAPEAKPAPDAKASEVKAPVGLPAPQTAEANTAATTSTPDQSTAGQDSKPVQAVEAKPAAIKVDSVLFAEAQTSSRRVGRVLAGQSVTLLAQGEGWAQIRTAGGVTGYVSVETVAQAKAPEAKSAPDAKPTNAAAAPAPDTKAPEMKAPEAKTSQPATTQPAPAQEAATQEHDVVSIASANVYATPDAKGKRVAKLTEGQTVTLIELLDDGWAKIKTKSSVVGYAKDDGLVDPDVYESRKATSAKTADAEAQRQREERQRADQEKPAQAEAMAQQPQTPRSSGGGSGGSSQTANPQLTALAERFQSACGKTGLSQAKCRNLANTIRQGADPSRGLQTVGGALPGDRIIRGPFAGALIVRDEGNGTNVYATQASPRNDIQVSRFDGAQNGQAPMFQSGDDGLDLGGILQGVISGAVSGAVGNIRR